MVEDMPTREFSPVLIGPPSIVVFRLDRETQ